MPKTGLRAVSLCLLVCPFSGGYADTRANEAEGDAWVLPPVTATATKQGTTTFDTPGSVSVLDEETLKNYRYQNLGDVAERQPNLYWTSFSGSTPQLIFRGLGFSDDESDSVSSSVIIDGVPVFGLALSQLFDVKQIEVLRGPQSTLYGQNSMAGLVALQSQDPQLGGVGVGGQAALEYATGNRRRGELSGDIALSENTALRVSIGGEWADGYTDNETLGRDDTADWNSRFGRLRLVHRDRDGGEWRFGLHGLESTGGNDFFAIPDMADDHESSAGDAGRNDVSLALFTGEYRRTLDGGPLWVTTVGSSRFEWNYWLPESIFGARSGYDMEGHQSSIETRLSNRQGDLDWLAGGFLSHSRRKAPYTFDMGPSYSSETHSDVTGQTAALFGEAGWRFAPGWRAAMALRLEHNRREMDWSAQDTGLIDTDGDGVPDTNFANTSELDDVKVRDNVWLPRFTLEHRSGDRHFSWLTLARGYKAPGFNLFTSSAEVADSTFAAEYGNYIELGHRMQDELGIWELSGNVFYMRLEDQQVVEVNDQGATMTTNAGRSHSTGVELEGALRPLDNLELRASAAFLEAEYDHYQRDGEDLSGERFPSAPRYSYGLAVQWQPTQNWTLGASAMRQGETNVYGNTSVSSPAYTQIDAMTGYRYGDWDLSLFGKNLADADYYVRAMNNGMVVPGAPRTVGVRVALDF